MKITKRQLKRIIRETFLREGYSVPQFSNSASMQDWVDELIEEDSTISKELPISDIKVEEDSLKIKQSSIKKNTKDFNNFIQSEKSKIKLQRLLNQMNLFLNAKVLLPIVN